MTPRISLVAWKDRVGGFVFVMVPNERGRYLRTDKSVVLADCPLCRATKGEPCFRRHGRGEKSYSGGTHAARRLAAGMRAGRWNRKKAKPHFRLCGCGAHELVREGT